MSARRRSNKSERKYAPSTPPTICASAASATSRGAPVSAHQSRKAERNPWTVGRSAYPLSRRIFVSVMLESSRPRRRPGNTSPLRSSRARARSRTAIASGDKGDPMGRSRLRPTTGDAPLAGLRIYLAPSGSASLPGSSRRQDQEPEAKFGRLARLQPIHGFKRRRYFLVRQCSEVRLDGRHGRQRALDSFPGHVLLNVAMRPNTIAAWHAFAAGGGERSHHPGL